MLTFYIVLVWWVQALLPHGKTELPPYTNPVIDVHPTVEAACLDVQRVKEVNANAGIRVWKLEVAKDARFKLTEGTCKPKPQFEFQCDPCN